MRCVCVRACVWDFRRERSEKSWWDPGDLAYPLPRRRRGYPGDFWSERLFGFCTLRLGLAEFVSLGLGWGVWHLVQVVIGDLGARVCAVNMSALSNFLYDDSMRIRFSNC